MPRFAHPLLADINAQYAAAMRSMRAGEPFPFQQAAALAELEHRYQQTCHCPCDDTCRWQCRYADGIKLEDMAHMSVDEAEAAPMGGPCPCACHEAILDARSAPHRSESSSA